MAIRAGVPVIPFFLTMQDSDKIGADGFPIPRHTVHILPPIYPDTALPQREAAAKMAEENYRAWCQKYEEVYGLPVRYDCEVMP
jgi:1-acyl-sn-glycerol-3-phosphate acyltransferase